MRLLRSRARVQVDDDTQVEGQVERAVEIFSRVEDEIRDAELQALRQRLQHEATLVEREVVHYANLTEAARASMRTISESLSWQKQ